jgi:hypothetical protein
MTVWRYGRPVQASPFTRFIRRRHPATEESRRPHHGSRDQAPPEETLDGRVPDGGQGAAGSCDAMKAQLRVGV